MRTQMAHSLIGTLAELMILNNMTDESIVAVDTRHLHRWIAHCAIAILWLMVCGEIDRNTILGELNNDKRLSDRSRNFLIRQLEDGMDEIKRRLHDTRIH